MPSPPDATLNDLYGEMIIDHHRNPRHNGTIPDPDLEAEEDNPFCGDRVTVDLSIEDGRVTELGHHVRGCLLCEAAASVIGCNAVGETPEALRAARAAAEHLLRGDDGAANGGDGESWPAIADFTPVRNFKSRHECVLLPFEALAQALDEATDAQGQ